MTPVQHYADDHKFLIAAAAEAAGIADPVAFDPATFQMALLEKSTHGAFIPLSGVLIRDWNRNWPKLLPGIQFGARVYTAGGIRFVRVTAQADHNLSAAGYEFFAVERVDYTRLYRLAKKLQRTSKPGGPPPVMPDDVYATLRQNTLDFLAPKCLTRIKNLGGRPKRGLLLTGPPGNGKTSACRWVLEQCTALGYETKQITPDEYRAARGGCNPAAAIRELFRVTSRGVVFFDDMDIALRNRDAADQPEDQAVFLGALDGIETNEGVVYVFTTNLPLDRIDPAFKRPGRIDLVLPFPKPDVGLRRTLIDRWHADVRAAIDPDVVAADTEDYSFAEVEELKNLLVMRYMDSGSWDWEWAKSQFAANRADAGPRRAVGFAPGSANGTHVRVG